MLMEKVILRFQIFWSSYCKICCKVKFLKGKVARGLLSQGMHYITWRGVYWYNAVFSRKYINLNLTISLCKLIGCDTRILEMSFLTFISRSRLVSQEAKKFNSHFKCFKISHSRLAGNTIVPISNQYRDRFVFEYLQLHYSHIVFSCTKLA